MEMHNIINISSINKKKWFNNINNEMADLLFLKLFVTMEDMNYKCLRVDIIFK